MLSSLSMSRMYGLSLVWLCVHARACLAVPVSPGPSVLVPRLASRVTLAVRTDARDVIPIYQHIRAV